MYWMAFVGLAMALYYVYIASQGPRPAVFVAIILWALYAVWEVAAARGALVEGVYCQPSTMCQIGYDLFFWPILLIASLFASNAPGQWTSTSRGFRTLGFVILALLCGILGVMFVEDWASGRLKRDAGQTEAVPKVK